MGWVCKVQHDLCEIDETETQIAIVCLNKYNFIPIVNTFLSPNVFNVPFYYSTSMFT